MRDSRSLVTAVVVLCAFAGACHARYIGKTYDGPDLADDEVGTIRFNDLKKLFNNQAVLPCKLDGVRVDADANRSIIVKPGKHTLQFMYDGAKRKLLAVEWTFNVEAGHRYVVSFPEEQPADSVELWLEDLSAGRKVTDITSSPLKGGLACF
jgi:hypothetical protein